MSLSTAVFIAAARARARGTLPVHPGAVDWAALASKTSVPRSTGSQAEGDRKGLGYLPGP